MTYPDFIPPEVRAAQEEADRAANQVANEAAEWCLIVGGFTLLLGVVVWLIP